MVEARQKALAQWTSEGERKRGIPEYVRRSRPSVIKGQRMLVRAKWDGADPP